VQRGGSNTYCQGVTSAAFDLSALGWDDAWRASASAYSPECLPGRIARVDRGLCTALTESGAVRASWGSDLLDDVAADTVAAPCTGDWAMLREWPDGPTTVEGVLTRRTAIVRAEASGTSHGQVLAANVDLVAAVVALHPEPHLGRLERLLTLAWESGAQPIVILTKADLVNDTDAVSEDVAAAAPGVDVICCSTVTGMGIDEIREALGGRATLALLGVSGHGKSSLTNALVGAEVLSVRSIRQDGKGRHTSVRRELVLLPTGGAVIDTPGMRGVGLQESGSGMASTFPDVVKLASWCRFTDCSHNGEPGCAVQEAVAEGTLDVRRLDSWRRLQREAAWMAARSDARLRSEQRKKWKTISKQNRSIKPGRS
jgi:ribosome biogenesis GTPase / thiamine phosphate phosphatase